MRPSCSTVDLAFFPCRQLQTAHFSAQEIRLVEKAVESLGISKASVRTNAGTKTAVVTHLSKVKPDRHMAWPGTFCCFWMFLVGGRLGSGKLVKAWNAGLGFGGRIFEPLLKAFDLLFQDFFGFLWISWNWCFGNCSILLLVYLVSLFSLRVFLPFAAQTRPGGSDEPSHVGCQWLDFTRIIFCIACNKAC